MNAQLPAALAQHPFAPGFEPREIDQLASLARLVRAPGALAALIPSRAQGCTCLVNE
jgi:hypothetical protein